MNRKALIIGNNNYKILGKLDFAIEDAKEVANKLEGLGFEADLKLDLDSEHLADAIIDFTNKLDQYDVALLYYAGHGFQVNGENVLAPIDLDINVDPKLVKRNAFSISELMEYLSAYPQIAKVVILDACRSIVGHRGMGDYAPISAPPGAIIAFATSPGQASLENNILRHGRYTECLLRYMDLPRVPIETVFKKVRQELASVTGGAQISWEHTSLISDLFLNPDTIYENTGYSTEAYEDARYIIFIDGFIKEIVEDLKSHTWPIQERGINKVEKINYKDVSSNDLFVLGRNIYQAADGNCFAVQNFIDRFDGAESIPNAAKLHILNGMLYEIYFDSSNRFREEFKLGYFDAVLKCCEKQAYYASKEFISSQLYKQKDVLLYYPGQNELLELCVFLEKNNDGVLLNDIAYKGRSVLYFWNGEEYTGELGTYPCRIGRFERMIAESLAAPTDYLRIKYMGAEISRESEILIAFGKIKLRFGEGVYTKK